MGFEALSIFIGTAVHRPVIRQCGHVAHSKCVDQRILSLHSHAIGVQPCDREQSESGVVSLTEVRVQEIVEIVSQ